MEETLTDTNIMDDHSTRQSAEPKVAIITGSSAGIGYAIAEKLLRQGCSVVITSRSAARAKAAATTLEGCIVNSSQKIVPCAYDITEDVPHHELIKTTLQQFSRIDYLVNNAISQKCSGPLELFSEQEILSTFSSNIGNTLLLSQNVHPFLKDTDGAVLNIGSVIVDRYLRGLPLYAMIKGALAQMTKVLAAEWGEDNIRVNAINPGFIRTQAFASMGMSPDLIDRQYAFYKDYCPLGKVGQPQDIADIAYQLLSSQGSFITGTTINVDGGFAIQGTPLFAE